jgi:hypothetical protein
MAESGTWPSIKKYGLRSTSSLLDLYGITGKERDIIEATRRASAITLKAPGLPPAVIRDQAPINEAILSEILKDELEPSDWYRILNSKVFFWVTEKRLNKLLGARLYRGRAHTVLEVDTAKLLEKHLDQTTLSPINSGNTMMAAACRGLDTFQPLSTYPLRERRQQGRTPVVELAVDAMVTDVEDVVVGVQHRAPGDDPVRIWPR